MSKIVFKNETTPATPASGYTDIFVDVANKRLKLIDDTGTVVSLTGDVVGPSSSTDNAIARFDSTTGKVIQNSGINIDDGNPSSPYQITMGPLLKSGLGKPFTIGGGSSTNDVGGQLFLSGGDSAISGGNKAGGNAVLIGGDGAGSGNGGDATIEGGIPGATGNGGNVAVIGGIGGATSGVGGQTSIYGGNAQNGDSDGGAVLIAGGTPNGSGTRGDILLAKTEADGTAQKTVELNVDNISEARTITFPDVTGNLPIATSGAGVPTGTAPASIGLIYVDTAASKVYISKGTSAGSDWLILN